jgi:hypothetical protein
LPSARGLSAFPILIAMNEALLAELKPLQEQITSILVRL